jgi:hypothetical protein
MAEARITVTFTPREFDLIRESLEARREIQDMVSRDHGAERPVRDHARSDAAQLAEILLKLK